MKNNRSQPKSTSGFTALEHRLLQKLRRHELVGRALTLAVSGGADSLALLILFKRLETVARLKLRVVHVHHGATSSISQKRFRDRAWRLVRRFSHDWDLEFVSNLKEIKRQGDYEFLIKPSKPLKSEADFRQFRYVVLEQLKLPSSVIVTAHNASDLLETRLIRLIRGTGVDGLVAMSEYDKNFFRPFLDVSRGELEKTLEKYKVRWLNDPSNLQTKPLRNWLRQKWLKDLEKQRPGSLAVLALSLQNIAESVDVKGMEVNLESGIDRQWFLTLTPASQRQILARYMRELNIKNYTTNHIQEVLKRLDNGRAEHNFTLLKYQWQISRHHIRAWPREN